MILDDIPPGPIAALLKLATRWRFIVACMAVSAGAAWAYGASRPRLFVASALLTTIGSQRQTPSFAGLPAGLLGGATGGGGIQATPNFLARMAKLPSILRAVGLSPVDSARNGERIVERYLHHKITDTTDQEIPVAMDAAVRVGLDEPTGLLTVSAANVDSTLARRLVEATVASASRAFIEATHAQAAVMRTSQTQRIDSASRQLRSAEGALRAFLFANRTITTYSAAGMEQMRLQRELDLAQNVYNLSVADRQAAIAKELDDSPALVVLDPVAPKLSLEPRRTKLYVGLALVLAFLAASTWVFGSAAFTRVAPSVALPNSTNDGRAHSSVTPQP